MFPIYCSASFNFFLTTALTKHHLCIRIQKFSQCVYYKNSDIAYRMHIIYLFDVQPLAKFINIIFNNIHSDERHYLNVFATRFLNTSNVAIPNECKDTISSPKFAINLSTKFLRDKFVALFSITPLQSHGIYKS